ncbi:MAG: GNAT family N-acetyltransferase [Candidatus Omnitrophica bacterium]|nr:GNAT family N-acetyltransferase [Candidatus Omnitrophota bacterium]
MTIESNLKIKIVRRIEEVSPVEWCKAFPEVVENYYFFKTLDESNLTQFSFFYILVYDNNTLVGTTNGFIMNFPLDIAVTGKFKAITNFISRILPKIFNPKILICGLPMGQGRIGICAEPQSVIQAICRGMEELACAEKAGIIAFKDFDPSYNKVFDNYLDKGFFKIDSLPSTEMDINFKSFSEYMMKLGSVSRSGLKRKFKEIDGKIKIDLEVSNELEEGVLSDVHSLYLQTYDKQEMGLEKLSIDFFRNISNNMPQETKFFLWRIDNKLVAFALCLAVGDYFIDYYLGFDYSVAFKRHLYFVRFRDLMNWCIENKMKKYEMGATGYEPKRRLGFKLIPLYIYVKHRNKFLNSIFKIFCQIIQPSNFHPVFKELK